MRQWKERSFHESCHCHRLPEGLPLLPGGGGRRSGGDTKSRSFVRSRNSASCRRWRGHRGGPDARHGRQTAGGLRERPARREYPRCIRDPSRISHSDPRDVTGGRHHPRAKGEEESAPYHKLRRRGDDPGRRAERLPPLYRGDRGLRDKRRRNRNAAGAGL